MRSLAQYNKEGARLPGPDNFDQLLMKRATITGFFCPDFLEDGPRIESMLSEWYKEGSLKSVSYTHLTLPTKRIV